MTMFDPSDLRGKLGPEEFRAVIEFLQGMVASYTSGTDTLDLAAANLTVNGTAVSTSTDEGAKAWVNYDQSGTPDINDSSGVDSVTDNATGQFTVNLTNDFSDINYLAVASTSRLNAHTANRNINEIYDVRAVGSAKFVVEIANTAVDSDMDGNMIIFLGTLA